MKRKTGAICDCGWYRKSRRGFIWEIFVDWSFDRHDKKCKSIQSLDS